MKPKRRRLAVRNRTTMKRTLSVGGLARETGFARQTVWKLRKDGNSDVKIRLRAKRWHEQRVLRVYPAMLGSTSPKVNGAPVNGHAADVPLYALSPAKKEDGSAAVAQRCSIWRAHHCSLAPLASTIRDARVERTRDEQPVDPTGKTQVADVRAERNSLNCRTNPSLVSVYRPILAYGALQEKFAALLVLPVPL